MLIRLKIQNIILVDSADITFDKGLNIITGETGSGKSALLSAIQLIAGHRADSQLIGKNGDLGVVEAELSHYSLPYDMSAPPKGENLLIRREIHKSGKSRCFVSDNLVSLSILRQIVGTSIELVDQSSSQMLCSLDEQRNMLDTFGDTVNEVKKLEASFSDELQIQKKLEELIQASETRSRDLAWEEEDLKRIDEVNWGPDEEEKLNQEHHLLTHAQELLEKMDTISSLLSENSLKKATSLLDGCSRFDATLPSLVIQLKSANLEIEEVQRALHSLFNRLEADPRRLKMVEDRLASIEQIKRRFGKTFEDTQVKRKEINRRIDQLTMLDQELTALQLTFTKIKEENLALAKQISVKRKSAAAQLAPLILAELHTLNLPNAQFTISIENSPLTSHGCDSIRFLFSANAGHPPIPVEECASGGELSRLLLAIKTILTDKENSHCLVFDEIDSNVGGHTATILGGKLKKIAQKKQVICVTHFVQVARYASHHFAVAKHDQNGRTTTNIALLNELEKTQEYQRMLGSF